MVIDIVLSGIMLLLFSPYIITITITAQDGFPVITTLTDVGTNELNHLEIEGAIVYQLTK